MHKFLSVVSLLLFGMTNCYSSERPNIIVVLADDLGYSDLSCYGGEIPTPNIDRLAKNGAKFSQMYTSARCCPTRASLMTGLYPSQAGIGDFTSDKPNLKRGPGYLGRLTDKCVTLAEVLGGAGYGCYYVGKWHMNFRTGPIMRGFDEFYGYTRGHSHNQYDAEYYIRLPEGRKKEIDKPQGEYYATDVFNEYAIEFIKQGQKSDKPWFLFLGHSSPHFPIQAPPERVDKYEETYMRGWDVLRHERFGRMREIGLVNGDHWQLTPRSVVPVDKQSIANGYSGERNPSWKSLGNARQKDLARRMAVFAAMVEGVDDGVGKIVQHLQATNDLENTFILFLSDNGACYEWGPFGFDGQSRKGKTILHKKEHLRDIGGPSTHQSYGSAWANLGNTPFRLYKHFTNEGGISSPCIAHWPNGFDKSDSWIRKPSHVMDIMPTLMEVASIPYPATFKNKQMPPLEGRSLLGAIRGENESERVIGFDHQGARALRKGDWKLVWSKRMPYQIKWELYNLASDRCEMNDLSSKEPERTSQMAAEWELWAKRVMVLKPETNQIRTDQANVELKDSQSPTISQSIPRPLFSDPNYNGSCDPEVVWNSASKEWWVYYTARRATRETGTYVGTPIGAISSKDLINWKFRGYLTLDGIEGKPDMPKTFWAPGVISHDGNLHMFLTYKNNANPPWGGKGEIRHYVTPLAKPLSGWQKRDTPGFSQPDPIDASILKIDGLFYAYYRVGQGRGIHLAISKDLNHWNTKGPCGGDVNAPADTRGFDYQEAPYAFSWKGSYWMLTDPHKGLAVYQSDDGITWKQKRRILQEPGEGAADATRARHPSVAVVNDRAFIFYHTEPYRRYPSVPPQQRTQKEKLSFLQMAELDIRNGEIICDRNSIINLNSIKLARYTN